MLSELNRRLDAVDGYIDGVHERSEQNMPDLQPPYPNRLIRRKIIEEQVENSLFSPNLQELYDSVPQSFMGAEFIRQLIEHESPEERRDAVIDARVTMELDRTEHTSILAERNSRKAPQHV